MLKEFLKLDLIKVIENISWPILITVGSKKDIYDIKVQVQRTDLENTVKLFEKYNNKGMTFSYDVSPVKSRKLILKF